MHNVLNGSGPSGGSWEAPVDVWEWSWGKPGHFSGRQATIGDRLGQVLAAAWTRFGSSRGVLGGSLDAFGVSWGSTGQGKRKDVLEMLIFHGF